MANPGTKTSLRLSYFNADGVLSQREEIESFIDEHQLDVLLLNETHLKPHTRFHIPNYITYRNDRTQRPRGGTAILIKSCLNHYSIPTPALTNLEATIVSVQTDPHTTIQLISAYNAPDKNILDSDLDLLLDKSTQTILAGDLNAKHPTWNSFRRNNRGKSLFAYSSVHNLQTIAPTQPTIYPKTGHHPDIIDTATLQNIPYKYSIEAVSELISDHNPVLLTIHLNSVDTRPLKPLISWERYQYHINSMIQIPTNLTSTSDIDHAILTLTQTIHTALEKSKFLPKSQKHDKLPTHIRNLIKHKNQARRKYQHTLNPVDKAHLTCLQNKLKHALYEHRHDSFNDTLHSLNQHDNSLWTFTRKLTRKPTKIHPIHTQRGVVYTNSEKAEVFADTLELQFSLNTTNTPTHILNNIRTEYDNIKTLNTHDHINHTTPSEIHTIIHRLKPKKAPGPDDIPNNAIRLLGRKGIVALSTIFNAALSHQYFPDCWKLASVIVLLKPGKDPAFADHYRPISLLPTLGKTFERVLLSRLKDHTHAKQLLPHEQHGFRDGHSTTHQLMRVTEFITDGFCKKQSTTAVFLDIAKAFDKVWHRGLICKLHRFQYPLSMVKLIDSYLTNRRFQVKLIDSISTTRVATAGVPQGSILGPLLFAIFTADIPKPSDHNSTIALFADDTAILCKSWSPDQALHKTQQHIHDLEKWYTQWRITINPNKSTAIHFTQRRRNTTRDITMYNTVIPWSNQVKYLGLILDRRLTWQHHVSHVKRKAQISKARLYSLLKRNSKLRLDCKLLIYKSIIRPVLTYAAPVWGYAAPRHIRKLQTLQNTTLRQIVNAPWYVRNTDIHKDTKIPDLTQFIHTLTTKFYSRLSLVDNPTISSLGSYDPDPQPKHKRPKHILSH